jgi:TonB-dependent SusC/RagA subfamily outer membrane receptor
MMISWMLYSIGIGALLTLAAVSAESLLKSARIPVRFVWTAAIALSIGFTVAAPMRTVRETAPVVPVELLAMAETPQVATVDPTLLERITAGASQAVHTAIEPARRVMEWASATSATANFGAGALWLSSGIAALLLMTAVYARSMRESARWPRIRLLGKNVRIAPEAGPAVMGFAPPEIVIPQWVLLRNEQEQSLVLEHENEHVNARDPLLLAGACIGVALMPWNPAVWYMWSRLRLAVEVDCDQRVLKHGVQKPAYGELLVELSAQRPWNSFAVPAFSWGTSHLERRLVAMTPHRIRFSAARRLASASIIGLALVAACQSEMPTAAQVEAMDVAAVTQRVQRATDSTVYFVDNVATSKEKALAIASDEIGSVEVKRATEENAISEVRVKLVTDSIRELRKMAVVSDSGITVANLRRVEGKPLTGDSTVLKEAVIVADRHDAQGRGVQVAGSNFVIRADTISLARSANASPCTAATTPIGADGARIRIRGQSAQAQAAECPMPLIIIDGVRIEGGKTVLQNLNPNSIESVEILKGASAEGLYGSAAANGVISIKLKK